MGEYLVDYLDGGEGTDTFTFASTFGSTSFGSSTIGETITNFEIINSQGAFQTFTLGAQAASAGETITINVGTWARNFTSLSAADITFNGGTFTNSDNLGDTVTLGSGNDTIYLHAGYDVITAGAGNDTIDGGDGIDIAIFSGNQADYSITCLLYTSDAADEV